MMILRNRQLEGILGLKVANNAIAGFFNLSPRALDNDRQGAVF